MDRADSRPGRELNMKLSARIQLVLLILLAVAGLQSRDSCRSTVEAQVSDASGAIVSNPCTGGPGGAGKWTYHENSSSALTDTTVRAACATGFYNYVCSIVASTNAATAFSLLIEDSTTTTILGPYYLEAVAGRGFAINFDGSGGKKQTTSATLISVTTTGAIAHSIDIQGYCGR